MKRICDDGKMTNGIEIGPYGGGTRYAKMREDAGNDHEYGLCAEVRASFMDPDDRIIIRSSEIVGYENGYFYDDHIPTYDLEGRGRNYKHTSHGWNKDRMPGILCAECRCGPGDFYLELKADNDHIDIDLSVKNCLDAEMKHVDWNFCAVGYDSSDIGDDSYDRTYVSVNGKLVCLGSLIGKDRTKAMFVDGGDGYFSYMYKDYGFCPERADESVVIIESADGKHSVGLGFSQSNFIFCGPWNKCFHADPYFGAVPSGGRRSASGKMYFIEGNAGDVLRRYREDFR
jgi:hypothetical protein